MGFHDERRYWYHLSSRLDKRGKFVLKPWGDERAVNRDFANEPDNKRICVAPTIPQCLTALPQSSVDLNIYRTLRKVKAEKPVGVFDAKITQEGWLTKPIMFVYIGTIKFRDMENEFGNQFWPEDAACASGSDQNELVTSKEALEEWIELMPTIEKYTIVDEKYN